MSDIKSIEINYQSNYNGCYLYSPEIDDSLDDEKAQRCVGLIVAHAYNDCTADGEFEGNFKELREFAIKTVRHEYGDEVDVTFQVDSSST